MLGKLVCAISIHAGEAGAARRESIVSSIHMCKITNLFWYRGEKMGKVCVNQIGLLLMPQTAFLGEFKSVQCCGSGQLFSSLFAPSFLVHDPKKL